jgi:hypothetical protein
VLRPVRPRTLYLPTDQASGLAVRGVPRARLRGRRLRGDACAGRRAGGARAASFKTWSRTGHCWTPASPSARSPGRGSPSAPPPFPRTRALPPRSAS